jgi:hypothetical protein
VTDEESPGRRLGAEDRQGLDLEPGGRRDQNIHDFDYITPAPDGISLKELRFEDDADEEPQAQHEDQAGHHERELLELGPELLV